MKRARTQAREAALKALYQLDLRPELSPSDLESQLREDAPHEESLAFARSLVEGTRARIAELDAEIEAVAENWTLARMATIDRNVLRLGAYELLHLKGEVPAAVVIDEAISLAKAYSTRDSGAFVNGILDKIHQRHRQDTP